MDSINRYMILNSCGKELETEVLVINSLLKRRTEKKRKPAASDTPIR